MSFHTREKSSFVYHTYFPCGNSIDPLWVLHNAEPLMPRIHHSRECKVHFHNLQKIYHHTVFDAGRDPLLYFRCVCSTGYPPPPRKKAASIILLSLPMNFFASHSASWRSNSLITRSRQTHAHQDSARPEDVLITLWRHLWTERLRPLAGTSPCV